MANKSAALEEIRKTARRRVRNRLIRGTTRTEVKKANQALAGSTGDSEQAVREAMQALDKAAQKGILHKNNAARRKSRLMKKLKAAQAPKPS